MRVIAIVPARCGSKGFPDKNIAKIAQKTLLELAIKVGLDSKVVNDVYVSADCEKYHAIALAAGAKSLGLRPQELATDTTKSIDVIVDLLESVEEKYDYMVLLQPTSPLRSPEDIDAMFLQMKKTMSPSSVSVVHIEEPHPYKLKSISKKGYLKAFIKGTDSEYPRQSLAKIYALNGAIYIIKIKTLLSKKTLFPKKTCAYIMKNNINIDSEDDFLYLKYLYENKKVHLYGV